MPPLRDCGRDIPILKAGKNNRIELKKIRRGEKVSKKDAFSLFSTSSSAELSFVGESGAVLALRRLLSVLCFICGEDFASIQHLKV